MSAARRTTASGSTKAPAPRRVLGIDPGSRKLGWAVVERRGPKLTAVAAGVLRLDTESSLAARLVVVEETFEALVEAHAPTEIAIEEVFHAKFPRAAIVLAHVRGVVLLAAEKTGLPIGEHAPALVKRTVAGRGAADKLQLARIVAVALRLRTVPPADAADALAIAMTQLARPSSR
jgi:crossover junction endodeoxyribonuclease RuvC